MGENDTIITIISITLTCPVLTISKKNEWALSPPSSGVRTLVYFCVRLISNSTIEGVTKPILQSTDKDVFGTDNRLKVFR